MVILALTARSLLLVKIGYFLHLTPLQYLKGLEIFQLKKCFKLAPLPCQHSCTPTRNHYSAPVGVSSRMNVSAVEAPRINRFTRRRVYRQPSCTVCYGDAVGQQGFRRAPHGGFDKPIGHLINDYETLSVSGFSWPYPWGYSEQTPKPSQASRLERCYKNRAL